MEGQNELGMPEDQLIDRNSAMLMGPFCVGPDVSMHGGACNSILAPLVSKSADPGYTHPYLLANLSYTT